MYIEVYNGGWMDPSFHVNYGEGAHTMDLTLGPDGNVWYIRPQGEGGVNTRLEMIDAAGNISKSVVIAPGTDLNNAKISSGPGKMIWFTDGAGAIGRLSSAIAAPAASDVRLFTPPSSLSGPTGITVGPDGNIWFTERTANKICRFVPPL
jgi:virginiamycin B lyase